jgi:hypothetical protein
MKNIRPQKLAAELVIRLNFDIRNQLLNYFYKFIFINIFCIIISLHFFFIENIFHYHFIKRKYQAAILFE